MKVMQSFDGVFIIVLYKILIKCSIVWSKFLMLEVRHSLAP